MSIATHFPHLEKPVDAPAHLVRLPRIRVAQIVADYLAYGWSVDEMCRQHDYLTQAEAHAAMTYYYDHRAEIDAEIHAELTQLDKDFNEEGRSALAAKIVASLSE